MSKNVETTQQNSKLKLHWPQPEVIRPCQQLAAQYNVHPTQISTWKSELIENAASLFSCKASKDKANFEDVDKLHSKIGQLTMENDFLAKVLGR